MWRDLIEVGRNARVATMRHDHSRFLSALAEQVVALLGLAPAEAALQTLRLRAVIEGLITASCDGLASPEEIGGTMTAHLEDLAARGLKDVA